MVFGLYMIDRYVYLPLGSSTNVRLSSSPLNAYLKPLAFMPSVVCAWDVRSGVRACISVLILEGVSSETYDLLWNAVFDRRRGPPLLLFLSITFLL